jgi:hypothetical protein
MTNLEHCTTGKAEANSAATKGPDTPLRPGPFAQITFKLKTSTAVPVDPQEKLPYAQSSQARKEPAQNQWKPLT